MERGYLLFSGVRDLFGTWALKAPFDVERQGYGRYGLERGAVAEARRWIQDTADDGATVRPESDRPGAAMPFMTIDATLTVLRSWM